MSCAPLSPSRCRPRRLARPTTWLIVLIVVVGCYRFSLIGSGHFFWGDERAYLQAARVIDDIRGGAYRSGVGHVFEARGRPGHVLISMIPTLAQRVIAPAGAIGRDAPGTYDVASGFNVFVSLGVTLCVFAVGRCWTRSGRYALLIAAIFSLLCHSNVWIRHLMPYYASLLLMLAALRLVSSAPQGRAKVVRHAAAAGLLSALAYSCYPGYYAFVAINAVVLLVISRRRVAAIAAFATACCCVPAAYELVARACGTSYLAHLRELSGTIAHGHFGEGYLFAWRYLRDVEGPAGVALFVLFAAFVALLLWRRGADVARPARAAIAAAIAGYLFHASMGVLFGKMVFYGRLVGMYLPFLIAGAVLALMHLRAPRVRRLAVAGLTGLTVFSFGTFAWRYAGVVYPADFLFEVMAERGRDVSYPPDVLWGYAGGPVDALEQLDPQMTMVADVRPDGLESPTRKPPDYLAAHQTARLAATRFIGVNFKWVPRIREADRRFVPPIDYELIAEAPHVSTLPATTYEGRRPWERRRLARRRYTMRIYERIIETPERNVETSKRQNLEMGTF